MIFLTVTRGVAHMGGVKAFGRAGDLVFPRPSPRIIFQVTAIVFVLGRPAGWARRIATDCRGIWPRARGARALKSLRILPPAAPPDASGAARAAAFDEH